MIIITDDKTILMVIRKPRSKWYRVCCCGKKRHYRKDGSCKHTDAVFAEMRPEIAKRTRLDGFGGRSQS